MRIVLRLAIGLILGLILVLAALAIFLPKLAESPTVRREIERATLAASGRNFSYAELKVGLFPPRLIITSPNLAGPTDQAPPLLRAESVDLKLALLPLLMRTVVVDTLVIDRPEIHLLRTAQGFAWPKPQEEKPSAPSSAKQTESVQGAPPEEAKAGGSFSFGVRSLQLENGRLVIEDATQKPTGRFELTDLDVRAVGTALDEPIDVKLSGDFAQGGKIELRGSVALDGQFDLEATLSEFALGVLGPLLGPGTVLGGALSGDIALRSAAQQRVVIGANFASRDLVFQQEGVRFAGPVRLKADLDGPFEKLGGTFEIDATDGTLEYGQKVFVKPAGKPARVSGKLVPVKGGRFEFDEVQLQIHSAKARARIHGTPMQIDLEAPAFALAGWEQLIPALGEEPALGQLALQGIAVRLSPLDVRGRLELLGAGLRLPQSGEPLVVTGNVEALGTELQTRELAVNVAEQSIGVDGTVSNFTAAHPHYVLTVNTEGAALERLLAAAGVKDDPATGPLTLKGVVSGDVLEGDAFLNALRGSLRFDVGRGRLRGVSLLRSTFERLGDVGEAALLLGKLQGGRTLQRFYEDEFEEIGGTIMLRDGNASSEDLHLRYKSYQVDLVGSVRLADQALKARGKLTLLPEVTQVLADSAAGAGGDVAPTPAKPRVIPLASVTGTLAKPRVDLSREAVLALLGGSAAEDKLEKAQRKVEEKYGEEAGKAARDILDSILGGKR